MDGIGLELARELVLGGHANALAGGGQGEVKPTVETLVLARAR